jgi:tetratricopeptide (TPR) repeat protein
LIECYVDMLRNIRIHAATLELDLTHFMAYAANTEKAAVINLALQRIANEYEDSSLESKLTSVLLGIMALFSADRTSLSEAIAHFDRINFDLTKRFLLYEVSDTEIIQSTILEKAFGVLGLYHRGIALELAGRKDDAYEQYQLIGEFLFQFRQAAFTQSKTIFDFIAGAMYRGSVVLHQLGQPREAAANYRSFLVFHQVTPGTLAGLPVNGTIRLFKALSTYMDLLDRHFRRINFKSLSDDDQFQQLTGRDSGQIWMPESVREESILCSLLLASIDTSLPELKANPVFMEDLSALSHSILRRFARIGYLDGIVKVQKTRFQTTVVDPSMYRNLFHSLLAASKFEEAFLAAQMYLDGRECDRFTLLAIARLCLLFPSKIELVQDILQARLALHILEPWFQVPWLLTHGQYWIQKARTASLTEAHECFAKAKESFTQLAHLDASHAEAFYFLALIEAEANRDLSEAERLVKKSLHLNASDCRSWGLFALIKSARGDYEGALSICNCELANMVVKELR